MKILKNAGRLLRENAKIENSQKPVGGGGILGLKNKTCEKARENCAEKSAKLSGNSEKLSAKFAKLSNKKFKISKNLFAKISFAGVFIFALIFSATAIFAPKNENPANALKVGGDLASSSNILLQDTYFAYLNKGEKLDTSWTIGCREQDVDGACVNTTVLRTGEVVAPDKTVNELCELPVGSGAGATCEISDFVAPENGIYKVLMVGGDLYGHREIAVKTSAGAEINGRTWLNTLNLDQSQNGALIAQTLSDFEFYAVNDAGNIYKININKYNGLTSRISLNAAGNVSADRTCTSSYISTSQFASGKDVDLGDAPAHTAAGNCLKFRLFLEAPNADLPISALSADGTLNVLPVKSHSANTALKDLEPQLDPANLISNLKFTESQTATNKAGKLTFNIDPTFSGNCEVLVDVNNDGDFTDEIDREYNFGALGGTAAASVDFDGKDGTGANISPNSIIKFAVKFEKMGEIHLLLQDAEGAGGISMVLQNGASAGADKIYWNDTKLVRYADAPDTIESETPILCADAACGGAGISSNVAGGAHGWGYSFNADGGSETSPTTGLQTGGWGNRRSIDTWTYISSDTQSNLNALAPSLLTVNFDTNDADSATPAQQKVAPSTVATAPTPPAREHYTFAGWYLDDETFANEFSFSTKITQNTTLYAKWTEIRHDVSFNLGCETSENCSENPETENVFDGDSAEIPAQNPTRENQIFKGWQVCAEDGSGNPDNSYSYTGENVFYDFSAEVLEETELCAVWNPEFTVEFVDEDGDVTKSEKVENGESATAPEDGEIPVRDGEKFVGWDKKFDKITGNLTVQAIYEKLCPYNFAIFADDENCVAPKASEPIIPVAPNTGIRAKIFAEFDF